jgi:hypothetical protein
MKSLISPETSQRFNAALRRWAVRWPRTSTAISASRYSIELLLERRLWLFVGVDLLWTFGRLLDALSTGARVGELYNKTVFLPALLLLIPAIGTVVALERRAGGLDLALAVPSTVQYFARRIAPILVIFWAQGVVLLLLMAGDSTLPNLLRALYQTTEVTVLVGAATLFWATRIESGAGTMLATGATVLALWPWVSISPEISRYQGSGAFFWGINKGVWAWAWHAFVLAIAITLLALYARNRLRRPETMLA